MKSFIAVLFLVVLLLAALLVIIAASIFRYAVVRRKKDVSVWKNYDSYKLKTKFEKYGSLIPDGMEWIRSMEPEEVFINSFDDMKLAAHIIEHPSPRGIFLMCHGFRSNPLLDFAGGGRKLYDSGFTLVLIDQRAHGDSDGKYITYGVRERLDVKSWCGYLERRYSGLPIVLYGISMGASTVLMASSSRLPECVCGIIADCGYTSPEDICVKVLKERFHLPKFPVYYLCRLLVRMFAGFDLGRAKVSDALRENRLPVLFVHGKEDAFVPYDMSIDNMKSCSACESFLFSSETAGHGLSYLEDTDGYNKAVEDFLEVCGIKR